MKWNSLALLLSIAVLISLVGCSKSGGDKPAASMPAKGDTTDNQPSFPAVTKHLTGQWKASSVINEVVVQQAIDNATGNQEQIQQIEQFVAALRATTIDLEFNADGSMVSTGQFGDTRDENQGTWQVLKKEGDVVTIKTMEYEKDEREFEITLEGEDSFTLKLEGGIPQVGVMRFKRLR